MGTLERPGSGVVRIGGVDAARLSDRELSLLRREIGFVFQQFFLAEHATVRENVADGAALRGRPRRRRPATARMRRWSGLASPNARASSPPSSPGGAAAGGDRPGLVGRPAIVLADEPTRNLDSATGASIMALIRELNADGATIIMITTMRASPISCAPGWRAGRPGGLRYAPAIAASSLWRPWTARGRRGAEEGGAACQGRTTRAEGAAAGGECWAPPCAAPRCPRSNRHRNGAIVGVLGLSSSSQAGHGGGRPAGHEPADR